MENKNEHPAWLFVLLPAVTMLLGWGLRGYIGGGTYGAMIPGAFVALSLCLLLGYKMETAAIAAVFGAIGIGHGGTMTYGQTLGFLGEMETMYWGVIGCTLKGGIWGLLGGAILGLGLARDRYSRKAIIIGLLLMIPAFYLGRELINEPKLIYFSNREDRPRGESWAGLLFAAIALLAFIRTQDSKKAFAVPLSFSLWGLLGGAVGFGGGCLWQAFGSQTGLWSNYIGWWKNMEFSFGFIFGAALGWAAWRNREQLRVAGQTGVTPPATWGPAIGFIVFVIFMDYFLREILPDGWRRADGVAGFVYRYGLRTLFGFIGFGAIAIIFGLFSLHAAWQAAITLTVYRAALDYTRDLNDPEHFAYTLPPAAQYVILALVSVVTGYLAWRFMRGPDAVKHELLLVLWACYIIGCVRSFGHAHFFAPPEGKSMTDYIFVEHASLIHVHGIFTVSVLLATWWIVKRFPSTAAPASAQLREAEA